MGIYSGAGVFQIAMELEDAGRVFYETLAEELEDGKIADLRRNLAEQETSHYSQFKTMGEELVQRPDSRPLTWDELNFAQILIEEHVFSDTESARDVAMGGDLAQVLDTAIQVEKDSVLFYSELPNEVDEKDAPAVQEIINEEKRHVRALIEAKKGLTL